MSKLGRCRLLGCKNWLFWSDFVQLWPGFGQLLRLGRFSTIWLPELALLTRLHRNLAGVFANCFCCVSFLTIRVPPPMRARGVSPRPPYLKLAEDLDIHTNERLKLLSALRSNEAGAGGRGAQFADLRIHCGGWVNIKDVARCLEEDFGLIIHVGDSLATDPLKICVDSVNRRQNESTPGVTDEVPEVIHSLET